MKNIYYLFLIWGVFVCGGLYAQLPNAPHADYSSKKGMFTDPRDGKSYAYKKIGNFEWFLQNLAYEGEVVNPAKGETYRGLFLPSDPKGEVYGMLYPSSTNHTTTLMSKFCPDGWKAASAGDYRSLFNAIIEEYGISDVTPSGNYTGLAKYLRSGGVQGVDANGLWAAGTVIDPKAAEIGFNALPSGVFNGDSKGFDGGDATGTKASFLTGTWYHYFMTNGSEDLRNVNRNSRHHAAIRCYRVGNFAEIEITTPYPTVIELNQINSASKEQIRMRHSLRKADLQTTGFYLEKGKRLVLNLETIVTASDEANARVVIGSPGHVGNSTKEISLKDGMNTIEGDQHSGGHVYLRYVTDNDTDPQGKVKVSFDQTSEHVRAPYYVYGTTTDEEFSSMLGQYRTPDVIFVSDYVVVVATRDAAISFSMNENKDKWIQGLHTILEQEDIISGLDDNDPNPLHHRLKKGEVRHFMIETTSISPHATNGYTAYPNGSLARYLTYAGTYGAPWMIAHEVGHQHQQGAYKINKATESTVNIYSYAVVKHIESLKGIDWNRTSTERWQKAHETYLSLPIEQRIYDMGDKDLETIVGFNRDELRFMPWEQLMLLFGEDFYKILHRVTREENVGGGTNEELKSYLIWKSSQITGYDLRGFFNEWGIRVDEKYDKDSMNKLFAEAMLKGEVETLPYSDKELISITGQNKPAWCPLPLKGIKTSKPKAPDLQPADQLASKIKYTDYSSSKGHFQDARDKKVYTYKKYGNYDWFTQNLNWADDRLDPIGNRPASLASELDPQGEIYGRYYPTYASTEIYEKWCPEGWTYAIESDWNTLLADIESEYNVTKENVLSVMKAGGDRDDVEDGLWAKGAGAIDQDLSPKVGFNLLPAGVYSSDAKDYEGGDNPGTKASFYDVTSQWYHQIIHSKSTTLSKTNRNSRHYGSVRCIRPAAVLIDQAIYFEPIDSKRVGDDDFVPVATATSNLPLTFTSSNDSVAVIVNGKVRIVGSGTAMISVLQSGDDIYKPSLTLTRELTVQSNDATLHELMIDGQLWDINTPYVVPCDNNESRLDVVINVADGATVSNGEQLYVDVSRASTQSIPIEIVAPDGRNKQTYSLVVEKRLNFEDVVDTRLHNSLFCVNVPAVRNLGYTARSYTWYQDAIRSHGCMTYMPKDKTGKAEYHLEITTRNGEKVRTCPTSIVPRRPEFKAYPNPVQEGQILYIDGSTIADELIEGAYAKVYNLCGRLMSTTKIEKGVTSVTMPVLRGIYVVKVEGDGFEKKFTILVKR